MVCFIFVCTCVHACFKGQLYFHRKIKSCLFLKYHTHGKKVFHNIWVTSVISRFQCIGFSILDRILHKAYGTTSYSIMKLQLYFAKKWQMATMYQLLILTIVPHFRLGIRLEYGAKYRKCQNRLLEDSGHYEFSGISSILMTLDIKK